MPPAVQYPHTSCPVDSERMRNSLTPLTPGLWMYTVGRPPKLIPTSGLHFVSNSNGGASEESVTKQSAQTSTIPLALLGGYNYSQAGIV